MLSGDFCYITSLEQESGKIDAALELNAGHRIFKGHFPDQPVVPGVCMIQMVKELLNAAFSKKANLVSAGQIKFLSVIDPTENNRIAAEIKYIIMEDQTCKISASLVNGSVTYFKMNAIFGWE
ncbi:MAG: 3-hydroxyacyl-ACP dehydratase [Ferruginibacter sp.]